MRCKAININGERCKVNTQTTYPFCWRHTVSQKDLRVKKSKIKDAGKGLFARDKQKKDSSSKIFEKDENIEEYTGKLLSKKKLDEKYGDDLAPYAVMAKKDLFIDAIKKKSSVARYANDCHNSGKKCNARFSVSHRNQKTKVFIKADKKIKHGEEILVSYGDEYWDTPASKKKKKKTRG
jgi:uncharacterized protein